MHKITIEVDDQIVYQQSFEELDIAGLVAWINRPQQPRKPRSDKGRPRARSHENDESRSVGVN